MPLQPEQLAEFANSLTICFCWVLGPFRPEDETVPFIQDVYFSGLTLWTVLKKENQQFNGAQGHPESASSIIHSCMIFKAAAATFFQLSHHIPTLATFHRHSTLWHSKVQSSTKTKCQRLFLGPCYSLSSSLMEIIYVKKKIRPILSTVTQKKKPWKESLLTLTVYGNDHWWCYALARYAESMLWDKVQKSDYGCIKLSVWEKKKNKPT